MFVDEAKIRVKAGDGGNGCMAFRREKFVPRGGPSGGDGGRGGDVIMESSERHNTLVHFRFNPEYKAERGRHGEGSNKTGREGDDVVLSVPVGTIVYDELTGETGARLLASRRSCRHREGRPRRTRQRAVCDLGSSGATRTRAGLSRRRTRSAAGAEAAGRRRPRRISQRRQEHADLAHLGGPAQDCRLSLHHACSRISESSLWATRPTSAALSSPISPASSKEPATAPVWERSSCATSNVLACWRTWSTCPIPADVLIRCEDFEVITRELANFGEGLDTKPTIIVATKLDVANPDKLAKLKRYAKRKKLGFYAISAVTGEGIDELKFAMADRVEDIKKQVAAGNE